MENFREIYKTYYRPVRSFFARRGFPTEDCFDLTQETFLGIHRGMASYQHRQQLGPWVFTIARNVYRKRLRSLGADKRSGDEVSMTAPGITSKAGLASSSAEAHVMGLGADSPRRLSPERRMLDAERRQRLHHAVDRLPEAQRQCLTLYLEGLSYRQIARSTHLAIDTVKSHLRRARHNLRSALQPPDLEALEG